MVMMGNYEVLRPLGAGGMSDAYLAKSPAGRLVVLKKPRSYDPELLSRMRDEGRLGVKLYHPNLVETLDAFEFEGMPVLALGFVEGPTVDELRKAAPLTAAAVARLGCQIAEALGAIHAARGDNGDPLNAIHRDVSARNIIVTKNGDAVLIDLGIARTDELRAAKTETGMVLGTLRYMAPELVDGVKASPASDFYSLGCVMVEANTGQAAFAGTPSEMAGAIVTKGVMATESGKKLDPRLKEIMTKICAMSAADRFQEAHALSAALRILEGEEGKGDLARRAIAHGQQQEAAAAAAAGAPDASSQSASIAQSFFGSNNSSATLASAPPTQTQTEYSAPLPPPIAAAPMAPIGGGAIGGAFPAPQPAVRVARVEQPLELDVGARVQKRTTSGSIDISQRGDHYPKKKADYGWLTSAVSKIFVAVVLVGGGLFAWKWYSDSEKADDQAARERKAVTDAQLIKDALKDTDDCQLAGALWAYTTKSGENVIVDSYGKIPKQYQKTARCAVAAH